MWSGAELRQLSGGVALNEERNEVPDWAPVKAGLLFLHQSDDLSGLDLVICIGQSVCQLLDGLLFTQFDHENRLRGLYGLVNRRWLERKESARHPTEEVTGRIGRRNFFRCRQPLQVGSRRT
jgi:hypothetical protein